MKTKRFFLYVFALIASITNVWAGLPATGTQLEKGEMPVDGGKYYIYADTYSGGAYVSRYLYNNGGTLTLNTQTEEANNNYVWLCKKDGEKYTFQNVGDPTKWLAHKNVASSAYNFTLGKTAATHAGITIWSDGASRYLVTKNDGTKFDQAQSTYNQSSGDWCTDYVFIELERPSGSRLNISSNFATNAGSVSINGTTTGLPVNEFTHNFTFPLTLTATANNPYTFLGFFNGEENLGTSYTIADAPSEDFNIEARFALDIFSTSFENGKPVQIYNTSSTSYAIKMNSQSDYSGKAVNSGSIAWGKNETWVLVGDASSFKMYNTIAGGSLALTLAGTGAGSAATLTATGSELCITQVSANQFAISPVSNTAQSLNMHGGAGHDIKLYNTTDGNSKWNFRKIDLSKKLTLNYTTAFEGGKFVGNNKEIGAITTTIDGININTTVTQSSTFSSGDCYFPANAAFSMSGDPLHGWTITFNGGNSYSIDAIPAEGATVDVKIAANPNDPYQYLYITPDANGKPYRIPAIAAAPNGTMFAIADNRPCGNDIGYGEVDIKCRISNDNGATWGEEFFVADGQGGNSNVMTTGYGDAAIVADRVENKLLVMMVCGRTVCHNGRWHPDSTATSPNINRVARVYATYNEKTQKWEWTKPVEVTNSIYSLFLKDGQPTVTSMFIGSGRIAQSSKIKVGDYYRLYCSMWTRDGGNRVIYSDDFGGSWNILGTVDDRPAPGGDEPKCEELPDGSVLLSSRKYNGRYFNVFKYTNPETAEGSWTGVVATNEVGDLKWGGNSTNGEPLLVGNVLFQSAPTGNDRSDVSVFYKVLSNNPADYTPTKLSSGWTEIEISHKSSAYSAMCILPDKENIGLLYEESPGGYCIVYRPLILKDLLTPEAYQALSAPLPAFASEASPVWHHIEFDATGNVLCDQGDGNNATTAAAEEVDAKMWNLVGTKEQFYLVSKLGNYLAYDADNNRYTTTADKSKKAALTMKENIKGSWEIMRKGASKSMSENSGKVVDAAFCGESNQITFKDLTPEVYEPAIYSTEESPVWFQVQFNAGSAYITDQGAGNNLKTETVSKADAQFWQFIGTPEDFYMKSRKGNYVYFTNDRFATSATEKTSLRLVARNDGFYEIGRKGEGTTFNQWGGAGAGKEIGEYNAGDTNNPLQFVAPAPYFSTEEAPTYWWINLNTSDAVLEDKGENTNIVTAKAEFTNAKLWQLVGDNNNFYMKSKAGRYLIYNSEAGRFQTTTSADSKTALALKSLGNNNFEIQLYGQSGNVYMNPNGGSGTGKELGIWSSGDGNNALTILVPEEEPLTPDEFNIAASAATAPAEKLTLWYTQPATATGVSNPWMEYSLPIGNGQLGASLFGGVARDEILINEKTLWSGGPNEYGYYLPFGSVYIDDISGKFSTDETKPVKNYYRDLNLKTATGTVTYEDNDGVKYTRQYFTSFPHKAIVTKITASEAGKLNLRFTMKSGKPTVKAETSYKDGYAQFTGKLQTVSYNATFKVVAKGGYTSTGNDGVTVEEADEVLLIITASTDFVGNVESHQNGRAPYLADDNKAIVDAVAEEGWDAAYAKHVADHQEYFCRVELELDGVENNLPTNELITAYNAASGARNLMLEQLYYNYGRYLSITSSRGVDLPNNLQGIWNNTCTPPWHSDIHANINVQMNYWPVSAGNLNEMYEPFLNYIINEAAQPEWRGKATEKGATREDSWTLLTENNIFGGFSYFAPDALINNAWYVTHLWQHYRYTLDNDYLSRAFPAMKGASLFWVDRLVLAADGTYECPTEYSPEHGPGQENATAHAQQIVWECIDNTIKAAEKLNAVAKGLISQDDYELLVNRREKMDRGLSTEAYNGKWGDGWGITTGDSILREWKYTSTFEDNKGIERGHRHMSHLMALFPFSQLTPASRFFEPAINSMKLRGDESTGWSMGWKINLWARALMGDRSHAILRKALKHSTTYGTDQGQGGIYYNLFDSHAPFQIDGNFGAASGVNEMLLQSHTEVIDILPALPSEWSKGYVKGLKAVGDFTVDIKWEGNQARKVTITNNQGQPLYVKCNGLAAAIVTVNGAAYTLGEEIEYGGLPCYYIESAAEAVVEIDLTNATQTDKSALEALIAQTQELVDECFDYYTTEAELQTSNASGAYFVSTNAQEDAEGPIANLVDGSVENHFHSEYSTNVGAPHCIYINLGSDNAVSSFKFKYATRKAETDFPKTIEIYGSEDGNDYTLVGTVTDLPKGNSSETKYYTSPAIHCDKEYSYLRLTVTANNSGKSEAGGHPYFHMAELDLMPRTAEYVNNYPDAVQVPAAVTNANTAIATAKEDVNKAQTANEYTASLAALQKAYNELVAAIESGSLPVLVTTDSNNPIIYKIGSKRGDTKVLYYDLATTNMFGIADNAEGSQNQAWYFTKASDGKVYIHPYLGGGDVIAASSTGNAHTAAWAAPIGTENHDEWQIIQVNAEAGTYNIKAGDNSNYFSNNGGTGNKMGFWNGDPTGDGGSLFTFTRTNIDGSIWLNNLVAYKDIKCLFNELPEGEGVGYYTGANTYNTAYENATAIVNDEYANENSYKEAYTTLRNANETVELIYPQANKFYYIASAMPSTDGRSGKKIYVNENGGMQFENASTLRNAFQFIEAGDNTFYLYNVCTGLYLSTSKGHGGGQVETKAAEGVVKVAISNMGRENVVKIVPVGGAMLHAQASGSSVVAWNNADNAGASAWTIDEISDITALSHTLTVGAAGYSTLCVGYNAAIPADIECYIVNEIKDERVILEKIEDVLPANTPVIVKAAAADYAFNFSTEETDEITTNLLQGSTIKKEITDGSYSYYILAAPDGAVGLYKDEFSDDKFVNNAYKAYLAVEAAQGAISYGFTFGGTTGIEGVEAVAGEQAIYDLTGRKIEAITAPGLYIINGVKTLVE